MSEMFDRAELATVKTALVYLDKRAEDLLVLLGDKRTLSAAEKAVIVQKYKGLKTDLKTAAKYGTVSRRAVERTIVEELVYQPAVHKAALAMSPPINSDPITSHWYSAVSDVHLELSYAIRQLKD